MRYLEKSTHPDWWINVGKGWQIVHTRTPTFWRRCQGRLTRCKTRSVSTKGSISRRRERRSFLTLLQVLSVVLSLFCCFCFPVPIFGPNLFVMGREWSFDTLRQALNLNYYFFCILVCFDFQKTQSRILGREWSFDTLLQVPSVGFPCVYSFLLFWFFSWGGKPPLTPCSRSWTLVFFSFKLFSFPLDLSS